MPAAVKRMLESARAVVPHIAPQAARDLIATGALVVDVREAPEVERTGKVAGAIHVPRGVIEFHADPDWPGHDKRFDRSRPVIVYSADGQRSALAGKTLMDMGYERVFDLGAFKDWVESGGDIDPPIEPGM